MGSSSFVRVALAITALGFGGGWTGKPPAAETPAIVAGSSVGAPTHATRWPFLVQIHLEETKGPPWCAGSLVDALHVVTAAHCLQPAPGVLVPPDHIRLRGHLGAMPGVRDVFVHPEYRLRRLAPRRDIAVLRLAKPAREAPIAMATAWPPGRAARIAGWGARSSGDASGRVMLRETTVPIPPQRRCTSPRGGGYGPTFDLASMLCAGELGSAARPGRDACNGDSGGPLVVDTAAGARLAGVTSFGEGCGERHYGGYARVDAAKAWIDQLLEAGSGLRTLRGVGVPVVTARDYNSITLVWEDAGAASYGVWMRQPWIDLAALTIADRDVLVATGNGLGGELQVQPMSRGSLRLTIRAIEEDGTRGPGATIDAAPLLDTIPPATVDRLEASSATASTVQLTWSEAQDGESGLHHYVVEYATRPGGPWFVQRIAEPGVLQVGFQRPPRRGAGHWYRVRAYDRADNAGAPSPAVRIP